MCGIAGIYAYHYVADCPDRAELIRIRDYMEKGGPDSSGTWFSQDGRVGFGHRRLSIIDLSNNAAQPMLSADGRYVVTFNGEIYNYRELRESLERQGRTFRSASDTEVLLHLYAQKRADMVCDLRGMFAFAIWDTERRSLFLARDPYGIKPLYYADDGWTFRFASQVKALRAGGGCGRDPDPAGLVGFYLFGSVPEPYTTVTSIRALPAGATMLVDRLGTGEVKKYFSISQIYRSADGAESSPTQTQEAICAALLDTVRYHLVADVPVGVFLSAGIDSGAVLGLARDAGQSDIRTVTLGFDEFRGTADDETPLAAETARLYGARHSTRFVTRKEISEDFPKILTAMDQPSIDGINTWLVSKAAHEMGLKVAMSGLGGDELFGGYPSFTQIPHLVSALRWPSRIPVFPAAARTLLVSLDLGRLSLSPKAAGLLKYGGTFEGAYFLRRLFMPWELPGLLGPEIATEGLRRLAPAEHITAVMNPGLHSSFAKVATLESAFYMRNQLLRDTDWAGMAHGLEVRVPLVDSVLLKRCAPHLLATAHGRRKDMLGAAPSRPLPQAITKRPKTGFTIPLLLAYGYNARRRHVEEQPNAIFSGKHFAPIRADRGRRMTLASSIDRRRLHILALVTDAFGGYGGIAHYNRDLLTALAAVDGVVSITILPRATPERPENLPLQARQVAPILNPFAYSIAALGQARALPERSVIFCGHILMAPLAAALSRLTGAFLWLQVHGIDAWAAPSRRVRWGAERADLVTSVSRYTRGRMIAAWWKGEPATIRVLPNTVGDEFQPGPKPKALIARYGLAGKKVLLTVSRISIADRCKGHHLIIEALPAILQHHPEAAYVIAGDGDGVPRLNALVEKLGLMEHVRFLGRVPAGELVDHYRLADVFIMPSTKEGFGIVFLEAASSGLHVIGARGDGSWDALREGRVGDAIDPLRRQEIVESVCRALEAPSRPDPKRASVFSQANFRAHVAGLVAQLILPQATAS